MEWADLSFVVNTPPWTKGSKLAAGRSCGPKHSVVSKEPDPNPIFDINKQREHGEIVLPPGCFAVRMHENTA